MSDANNSGNILLRILEKRRESVAHRKRVLPLVAVKIAAEKKAPAVRDFSAAITANRVNVIAELKKASPSRGVIREQFEPAKLAAELAEAGAAALSVLTEEDFFAGSLTYLKEARAATEIPVLRKDFIFDPWQVWEARAAGADSFLLISAVLEPVLLQELLELGRQLGMEPLVEVHTREELAEALSAGAKIVGVNARDLTTFKVNLDLALELATEIPDSCIAVAESGIHSHEDLTRLSGAGFDAFLIGEQLMKHAQPGDELRRLLGAAEAKTARP
ncbi:MAG: indole-3-glycerol phosphate synthase TrpC [Candidatus Acidiferrales bacterium]|jgi:indole-3-glycerol phosphate synthase